MIFTAQLCAFAPVDPGLLYIGPVIIDKARNASRFQPRAGTHQACITSAAVVRILIFVSTGSTIGLSTFLR